MEELNTAVNDDITEEELEKIIAENKNNKDENKVKNEEDGDDTKKEQKISKKEQKDKIRVLDSNNKIVSDSIEKEKPKNLGIKKQKEPIHNKKIKRAKNGEYYEELADGIGMWSRTGQSFLLKDLNK